jgi:hypothetical protein
MKLGRESYLLVVLPLTVLVAVYVVMRPEVSPEGAVAGRQGAFAAVAQASFSAEPMNSVAPSKLTASTPVAVASKTLGAGGELSSAKRRSARVVGYDGRVLAGVKISVRRRLGTTFDGDHALDPQAFANEIVYTDAEGRLELEDLAGWRFDLLLESPGYGRVFLGDGAVTGDIVMPSPRDFAGRIVDAEGRPVAGATVKIVDGPRDPIYVTTDSDGRYVAAGAAAGGVMIEVRHQEYRAEQVFVRADASTEVDVSLQTGAAVSAAVGLNAAAAIAPTTTKPGDESPASSAPSAPLTAFLYDRWTRSLFDSRTVAEGESFAFGGLTPGRDYLISLIGGGRGGESVFRGGGSFPDVAFQNTGSLTIDVRSADGYALADAVCLLRRQDGLTFDEIPALRTDAAGRVVFPELRPDVPFKAVVYHPDYAAGELRGLKLKAGEDRLAECALFKEVACAGRVVSSFGAPITAAAVRITRADGKSAPALFAHTDADGSFRVDGVAAGEVNVLVLAPGYVTGREMIALGAAGAGELVFVRPPEVSAYPK